MVVAPLRRCETAHDAYWGLSVIGGLADHAGYTGVMLGLPGELVHLEITTHANGLPGGAPSADDLLVIYVDADGPAEVMARAREAGLALVASTNPYWSGVGAVIPANPDARHLVLVPQ